MQVSQFILDPDGSLRRLPSAQYTGLQLVYCTSLAMIDMAWGGPRPPTYLEVDGKLLELVSVDPQGPRATYASEEGAQKLRALFQNQGAYMAPFASRCLLPMLGGGTDNDRTVMPIQGVTVHTVGDEDRETVLISPLLGQLAQIDGAAAAQVAGTVGGRFFKATCQVDGRLEGRQAVFTPGCIKPGGELPEGEYTLKLGTVNVPKAMRNVGATLLWSLFHIVLPKLLGVKTPKFRESVKSLFRGAVDKVHGLLTLFRDPTKAIEALVGPGDEEDEVRRYENSLAASLYLHGFNPVDTKRLLGKAQIPAWIKRRIVGTLSRKMRQLVAGFGVSFEGGIALWHPNLPEGSVALCKKDRKRLGAKVGDRIVVTRTPCRGPGQIGVVVSAKDHGLIQRPGAIFVAPDLWRVAGIDGDYDGDNVWLSSAKEVLSLTEISQEVFQDLVIPEGTEEWLPAAICGRRAHGGTPGQIADLAEALAQQEVGTLQGRATQNAKAKMVTQPGDFEAIAQSLGLLQVAVQGVKKQIRGDLHFKVEHTWTGDLSTKSGRAFQPGPYSPEEFLVTDPVTKLLETSIGLWDEAVAALGVAIGPKDPRFAPMVGAILNDTADKKLVARALGCKGFPGQYRAQLGRYNREARAINLFWDRIEEKTKKDVSKARTKELAQLGFTLADQFQTSLPLHVELYAVLHVIAQGKSDTALRASRVWETLLESIRGF